MDLKRTALFVALGITSYFMLLAWNEDSQKQNSQLVNTAQSVDSANADLPSVVTANGQPENNLDDIPQTANNENTVPVTNNESNAELIKITTPVQVLSINPVGGDIVSLALPKYPVSLENPEIPFELLRNNSEGIYIAQSGLMGSGPDASNGSNPHYQSEKNEYILTEDEDELIVDLSFIDDNNISITKRFIFSSNDYLIKVQYIINNQSQEGWQARLYGQIKRDRSGDPSGTAGMGMNAYLGGALTLLDEDPYKKVEFDDIDDDGLENYTVTGGWIAFSQHYFISSWIPDGNSTNIFQTRKNNNGEYFFNFRSPVFDVAPGTMETVEAGFWAGPKDQYRMEEISPEMGLTIDYGFLSIIAKPIFWLLTQLNDQIGNYGYSIIALTLVIKILFWPFSAASYRSMAKTRKLAPKVQQIKDRYGDDKQKVMQEQMALWKKEKVNPLGGCLPMLLQMPVLMGIYWVLNESVELRQAPFVFWYEDLSVMDPYLILPIVMGASMFLSQVMSPAMTTDPVQAKVMKFMPLIFSFFFLWFPAGLVLYWLVSNVFNICQQYYINKKVNAAYENRTD